MQGLCQSCPICPKALLLPSFPLPINDLRIKPTAGPLRLLAMITMRIYPSRTLAASYRQFRRIARLARRSVK